jgi:hypothetical protein
MKKTIVVSLLIAALCASCPMGNNGNGGTESVDDITLQVPVYDYLTDEPAVNLNVAEVTAWVNDQYQLPVTGTITNGILRIDLPSVVQSSFLTSLSASYPEIPGLQVNIQPKDIKMGGLSLKFRGNDGAECTITASDGIPVSLPAPGEAFIPPKELTTSSYAYVYSDRAAIASASTIGIPGIPIPISADIRYNLKKGWNIAFFENKTVFKDDNSIQTENIHSATIDRIPETVKWYTTVADDTTSTPLQLPVYDHFTDEPAEDLNVAEVTAWMNEDGQLPVTGTITNGILQIDLPSVVPDSFLMSLSASYPEMLEGAQISIQPKDVKIGALSLKYTGDFGFEYTISASGGFSTAMPTPGEPITTVSCNYVYSNRDATVTILAENIKIEGSTVSSVSSDVRYDLKKGWNIVYTENKMVFNEDYSVITESQSFTVEQIPETVKWYYE